MSDCCSKNSDDEKQKVDLNNLDGLICFCFKKSKKELFHAVKNGENEVYFFAKVFIEILSNLNELNYSFGKSILAQI